MSLVSTRHKRESAPSGNVMVTKETAPELFCRAHGCQLRWSVQTADVTACSYHAWKPVNEWPAITEDLLQSGPWRLRSKTEDTPTVRDMKTRLRGRIGNVA